MELFSDRFSTSSKQNFPYLQNQLQNLSRNFTTTLKYLNQHFVHGFHAVEFKEQADDWKVRLLLRKLGSSEHDRYANYILPKHARDYNFDEMVQTLSQIFVDLPPQKMPVGTSNPHGILLHSQIMNRCDGLSKSTHSATDTNDDNCNKIEPFEYELQVDTSSEKKQDWSFTLYDFDRNGKITKEELSNLFQALYDAVGSSIHLPLNGTKKIKLRLSIGHDSSHVDKTLKDQSPLLVKKKAKLKNTSKLTEWKEMSLQAGAGQVDRVSMVDSKEYTKLNNLDASPRTKPSPVCKMENQLTPVPPGIGHRLTLSCKEQKKLTEMVHENMVRNQVRQQTGRKHHHAGHRHHHLHREARRHRSARRHGDENRKPREKDGANYLNVGGIERSSSKAVILPYSAGVPNTSSTTTATVTTTSVMTFARPVINIVPSSSSPPPPPPPPPTASGSTAHCNEIGMVDDDADVDYDGDNVAKPEVGGNVTCRKHENTWRENGRLEENAIGEDGLTVEISGPQDQRHLHHQPRHLHHHHHHHRHRHHHLHRSSGDSEHAKCKHCPEKCSPFNTEHLKSGTNAAVNSESLNKSEKKEILNRRHKHSNNTSTNANSSNNNNNNNDNNDNEINNDCTEKDVSNKHMNHQLSLASGVDMIKQENIIPTYKCHNSNANTKTNFDCVCSRCQKRACQVRIKSTGRWLVKCENELRQRKGNASVDGQEMTPETRALNSATTNTVTTGTVVTSTMPAPVISASSPCEKKTTERSSKRTAEERYKKHNEGHHHAQHSGRTRSQDCGVEQGPAVSSSVSAVVTKMTAPGATTGSIAERKSLRTHHKNDSSPQRMSSRHRTHCQNTLVPEKHAGGPLPSSAILHPPVSPPPPAPTPTAAVGVTPSMATTTTSTTLQQQHHPRRRNQASRNKEFNEAMQHVADWVNREHYPQAQQGPANDEHLVHVQRHEHHHVHEYHHHHHYHHYYQT